MGGGSAFQSCGHGPAYAMHAQTVRRFADVSNLPTKSLRTQERMTSPLSFTISILRRIHRTTTVPRMHSACFFSSGYGIRSVQPSPSSYCKKQIAKLSARTLLSLRRAENAGAHLPSVSAARTTVIRCKDVFRLRPVVHAQLAARCAPDRETSFTSLYPLRSEQSTDKLSTQNKEL